METSFAAFIATAHRCAMEFMNNALYIRREIPNVDLPPGFGERLEEACDALIEAKFDAVSELHDLDDRREKVGAVPDDLLCSPSCRRILEWLDEASLALHSSVVGLQEAAAGDRRYSLAYLLVAESAVNILNAHAAIPRPDPDGKPPA